MKSITLPISWLFFFCILLGLMQAQTGRFPDTGEAGIPGTVPNSYVIGWEPVEGALGYEYVVSDNPQCFVGCSGDTRQQFVVDTAAVEFNLQAERFYYWIIRTYFSEGDTSAWSFIFSFSTQATDFTRRMIVPAPNPIENQQIRLRLDWAQNPEAEGVSLTLINRQGAKVRTADRTYTRQLARFDHIEWEAADLPAGVYVLRADIRIPRRDRTDTFWMQIIIP